MIRRFLSISYATRVHPTPPFSESPTTPPKTYRQITVNPPLSPIRHAPSLAQSPLRNHRQQTSHGTESQSLVENQKESYRQSSQTQTRANFENRHRQSRYPT